MAFHCACNGAPSSARSASVTLRHQLRNVQNILFHTIGQFSCGNSCPSSCRCQNLAEPTRGPEHSYGKKILPGFLKANKLHVLKNVPELPVTGGLQITTETYHCTSFGYCTGRELAMAQDRSWSCQDLFWSHSQEQAATSSQPQWHGTAKLSPSSKLPRQGQSQPLSQVRVHSTIRHLRLHRCITGQGSRVPRLLPQLSLLPHWAL